MATVEEIRQLAAVEQAEALRKMRENRAARGYVQFVRDLRAPAHNQNEHDGDAEWKLVNGLLTITPAGLVNPVTLQEVQNYYHQKLSELGYDRTWLELPTFAVPDRLEPATEFNPVRLSDGQGYGLPLKVLGKNGTNKAVDPVVLVQEADGSVKVLAIKRFDGSRAFPGGMNESTVIDTCINELLEEVFSDDLFKEGSETERLVAKVGVDRVNNSVTALINGNDDFQDLRDHLGTILQTSAYDDQTTGQRIREILANISGLDIDVAKRDHMAVQLKCCLYQEFLPKHYKKFSDFVRKRVRHGKQQVNQSDARGTDYAHMETVPLSIVLGEGDFEQLTRTAGLRMSGGDDAEDAKFVPIETLWNEGNIFSDHGQMLLTCVADELAGGRLQNTDALSRQMEGIQESLPLQAHCINRYNSLVDLVNQVRQGIVDTDFEVSQFLGRGGTKIIVDTVTKGNNKIL